MTSSSPNDSAGTSLIESLTDPETVRDRDDVSVHELTETVDGRTFDLIDDLGNRTPIGLRNEDGEVWIMKESAEGAWTIPSIPVEPDEDYAKAGKAGVEAYTGIEITLDALEGIWHFEATHQETGETTTRYFVVYSASPVQEDADRSIPTAEVSHEDRPAASGWVSELPAAAADVPGTDIFFD